MVYLSEFVGSLVFLLGGYCYMSNITLKNTLIGKLNFVELSFAWSLSVGFGLCIAVVLGGPALLNPGVVFGLLFSGGISASQAMLYLLMEFLAAGVAVALTVINFHDSFKASEGISKRGIFSAYPVQKNLVLNFVQEVCATFVFLFLVLAAVNVTEGKTAALQIGAIGFAAVFLLSLTLDLTGFSMNAMRSVFSSIWFALIPIPNKEGEKVDWAYQLVVNLVGSTIGGVLAVFAVNACMAALG
ncbi:aquaporin [Eubacterium oxidoreducens]|uniref:Glycerol uptake facilitator protein n=1 Tax=Eubacterium oxidoreducens TaxID=1732 RepID=A0A1G6BR39_EUBOX|nr:aquaporin [Eubacterium oxidoreducens]SDB23047.1 glycerol uptake facilitator protein [Eubacterium oxidoreducens]